MDIPSSYFIYAGLAIHLTVFWLIAGKAITNYDFRTEVIRLPLWVIISISFLWPLTIVAIIIYIGYLITRHKVN